jgi:signal transduction histidine kinase
VDNAIKFSPDHSTVRIGAKLAQVSGWVEVFIADQGKGITPEVQANLFNKFQRDRKMTARRSGTGLGLYFCRLAVEAHGGKIWVESQVGHGSVFRFLLPSEMTI